MKNYGANHPLSKIYVTEETFGARLPENWQAIAAALNSRIDKIIAAENITEEGDYPDYIQLQSISKQTDDLWQSMLDGSLPDVPRPLFS